MYLLDTNICICAINRRPAPLLERIVQAGPQGTGLSSITAAELAFDALKSQRAGTRPNVEAFLATLPVFDWGGDAVWHYAETRLALERAGQRIGERDLFIAAHALALGWTIVTNDVAEFSRAPALRWENSAAE
jgi:tRNA(fMet)-specific endonuclease VapC